MKQKVLLIMIGVIILLVACAEQSPRSLVENSPIDFTFLEQQNVDLTKLREYYSGDPNYNPDDFAMWGIQKEPFDFTEDECIIHDSSKLQQVDFTKNYLLLSYNRKVEEFLLVDTVPIDPTGGGESPSDGPHGSALLGAEYFPDTVFIYTITRIEIKNTLDSAGYDRFTRLAE